MVFIRFRDSTSSEEFIEAYNGKAFNSLEVSYHLMLSFLYLLMCVFSLRFVMSFVFCQ